MALFIIPELNTRLGTYRAYHLAAIVLYADAIHKLLSILALETN